MKNGNKKFGVKDSLALMLGLELNPSKTYRLTPEKQIELYKLRANEGILNACENVGINPEVAPMLWLKTKHESVRVTNPLFKAPEQKAIDDIDFLSIFKDKVIPLKIEGVNEGVNQKSEGVLFDRLVYTDVHVGMNVNQDGYSLYDGIWNEEELNKRLKIMVSYTLDNQKSNVLNIHELGDFMDGWDGFTTRGGHALPQNMDNQKAFDIGLKFKIQLIDALIPNYEFINCVNICNDNHAGSFGYIVNSAFKTYIELKYPNNVTVTNQRKFIDHYIIDNRCFILCHGKDDKSLKFGFKPQIDPTQIEKIKNYIDEYKLHGYEIEFSKGDSHQLIFDLTSSTAFESFNFKPNIKAIESLM